MTLSFKPALRGCITGQVDPQDDEYVWLFDSYRFSPQGVRLHREVVGLVEQLNGRCSLAEIQASWVQSGRGLLPSSVLDRIVEVLDEALFLDGERYRKALAEYRSQPVRQPSCIGCYSADPAELKKQLDLLFTAPGGPGLPDFNVTPSRRLRGAFIPHIDYCRGNVTYGWGFKEVVEQTDAEVFVILGTSHFSPHRYTLTRKHFATPLGVIQTDQRYVEALTNAYGPESIADELAHVPEHSIELHAVLLQHLLLQADRPFSIVPLLVGSFHDCLQTALKPEGQAEIERMITALKQAEAACGKKVCYLISGDLAHIGPKFGDNRPLQEDDLLHSQTQDQEFLQALSNVDRGGMFALLHEERDTRRICGFPPAYTFLAAVHCARAQVLHYQQFVAARGMESVSFASVAFYG
jgi:AmmeMemoRadiSam system protein B